MFDALKRWRRRRVLERSALPDGLWAEAAEALPFVRDLDDAERARTADAVRRLIFCSGKVAVDLLTSPRRAEAPAVAVKR